MIRIINIFPTLLDIVTHWTSTPGPFVGPYLAHDASTARLFAPTGELPNLEILGVLNLQVCRIKILPYNDHRGLVVQMLP